VRAFFDIYLLALTIFFESGGDGYQSKIAHGWVVKNRVDSRLFTNSYESVVFHPKHFSCYNPEEIELHKNRLLSDNKLERRSLKKCIGIADSIYYNLIPDNTNGSLWYTRKYEYKKGKKILLKRKWMRELEKTKEIEGTIYYKMRGKK